MRVMHTVFAVACLAGTASASCAGMAGKWYDEASEDTMSATESNCQIATRYGTAQVDGHDVSPLTGIFRTLGITGEYHAAAGYITWSNGIRWTKLATSTTNADTESRIATNEDMVASLQTALNDANVKVDAHEARITELERLIAELRTRSDELAAAINAGGTSTGGTVPSGDYAAAADLAQLETQVQTLAANGVGRDGYCSVQPTVTSVYVPITRYVYRKYVKDVCSVGPVASPGGPGVPSMVTVPSLKNTNCRWTSTMTPKIFAYVGDTLIFWRGSDKRNNLWRMENEAKYKNCDFSGAKLVAGLIDFEGVEMQGNNFTVVLDKPGSYFFASDKTGTFGDERKQFCWDPAVGQYPGQGANWGEAVRTQVVVLNPKTEVMAQCPLYDPAKFGVTGGGGGVAADSASVERLKGAVAAMGRQIIANELRTQERVRADGNTGLTITRSTFQGTDAFFQESYVGYGVANMHNHADFRYTIGMGEFGAVLNGVQFTTRHNDYTLDKPDPTLTVEQYHSAWPPKSKLIAFPAVPPSVLAKSTVPEQITEMREYFKAFKQQNIAIRDYRPFFKAKLCYLEGTWAEAQDNVAEPFASDRHQIDADSWADLNQKTAFLMNNGQKLALENLPFLPTSFRDMWTRDDGSTFEPRQAQYFYRIKCMDIAEDVPTARFRVRQDLHVQMGLNKPETRAKVERTHRALFELNPQPLGVYNKANKWPVGKTTWEYIDELMERAPGFDGPQGNLLDDSFGPICARFDNSEKLNTAFYSRYFTMSQKDAMGAAQKKRGFNDFLYAAQTTHKRVSPQEACSEVEGGSRSASDKARITECDSKKDVISCNTREPWTGPETTGTATGAKCVWRDDWKLCVYKKCWEQRWSYAMPLEIVYTTPLTNWNPFGIDFFVKGEPGYNNVDNNDKNGQQDKPYVGGHRAKFFRTPAAFFKEQLQKDAADTSGGVTFVKDKNGVTRSV